MRGWIPFYGDRSVREKVRELKNSGMAVPVLFSIGVSKVVENFIVYRLGRVLKWLVFTVVLGVGYVYWSERGKVVEEAKDKVEETVE